MGSEKSVPYLPGFAGYVSLKYVFDKGEFLKIQCLHPGQVIIRYPAQMAFYLYTLNFFPGLVLVIDGECHAGVMQGIFDMPGSHIGDEIETQVFIDLVIALTLFLVWMFVDARERAIPAWPYALLILTTGSIGALAYLVHRAAKSVRAAAPQAA